MTILSWLLLIIGGITVTRGVMSRVGTDLFCPSCRQNVTGTWPDVDTCQECGKSIPKKRIVHGERVIWNKRGGVIASLGIAGLVAAVIAARMGQPVYTWYPDSWHMAMYRIKPNVRSLQAFEYSQSRGTLTPQHHRLIYEWIRPDSKLTGKTQRRLVSYGPLYHTAFNNPKLVSDAERLERLKQIAQYETLHWWQVKTRRNGPTSHLFSIEAAYNDRESGQFIEHTILNMRIDGEPLPYPDNRAIGTRLGTGIKGKRCQSIFKFGINRRTPPKWTTFEATIEYRFTYGFSQG